MKPILNYFCDYGVCCDQNREVRRVPIDNQGGAINLCKKHFNKEMLFRNDMNNELGPDAYEILKWEECKIVDQKNS